LKWSLPRARDVFALLREATRHVLRHPVVGVAVAARTPGGRWLLIRRRDTGGWALPGGTLEWGETLSAAVRRELAEEAGAEVLGPIELFNVYSNPERDYRFHAVTILVTASVSEPNRAPRNPLEITEVRLFDDAGLPEVLSMGMADMLRDVRSGRRRLE
jgi:8-oxo-dGTP diphosphatase